MKFHTVDQYISTFPASTQKRLFSLRALINDTCPDSEEGISYNIPAYKLLGKPLIYFAAYAHHIGVYATPQTQVTFARELKNYKQGKGSVQFPLGNPMPWELIIKMLQFKSDAIRNGS